MESASEAQPFLTGQHPIDPTFLIGTRRVKGRDGLGQPPESLVSSNALFYQEPFERFAAP